MTSNRWSEVEAIAAAALERDSDDRPRFLDEACGQDDGLRREVESLLRYDDGDQTFLQRSALEEVARACAAEAPIASDLCEIGEYQLLELLGAGGMGEVYRAKDLKLEREVAIKLFRWRDGDSSLVHQFEEEARSASGLNHPNIVTIHAVGSEDNVAYIVMELVRGRTLRAMQADGAVPIARTLEIAVQLGEGLAAAHTARVVHRDLKPENVMVTADGLVKILDFGIAKREHGLSMGAPAAARDRSADPVTRRTSIYGTAGYMSPEQASGRPVDHRSDQFSFGTILYELVCGHAAFEGQTKAQTIAAVTGEELPLASMNGLGAAGELRAIVARCWSKSPDGRFTSTHDLSARLRSIRDDYQRDANSAISRRRALWLTGAAAASTAIGLLTWHMLPSAPARQRLAVLPFANADDDPDAEYLAEGLTESLIRRLSLTRGLQVKALSAVLHFKKTTSDPRAIGRQLNADTVLTGSLIRRGGRLIVSAELIDVAGATRLWGNVLDRPETDVLRVCDEIAVAIIREGMGLTSSEEELRLSTKALTANAEAYRLYLQAVHYLRLEEESAYLRARELLIRALSQDPTFALAHVILASTYSVMAVDGYEAPSRAWPLSTASVARALELDPELPDAHAEASSAQFYYRWDWAATDREWQIALGSRRGEVQAELLGLRALELWALGRNEEGLRFARAARQADPLSGVCALTEADLLVKTGQLDAAATSYQKVIRESPADPRAYFGLAELRRMQGRFDEAIGLRRRAHKASGDDVAGGSDMRGVTGYARMLQQEARGELEGLREREATGAYVSPLDYARVHARLGDTEGAFKSLAEAFDEQAAGLVFLRVDTAWDNIRSDSRFRDAVRRVRLPAET